MPIFGKSKKKKVKKKCISKKGGDRGNGYLTNESDDPPPYDAADAVTYISFRYNNNNYNVVIDELGHITAYDPWINQNFLQEQLISDIRNAYPEKIIIFMPHFRDWDKDHLDDEQKLMLYITVYDIGGRNPIVRRVNVIGQKKEEDLPQRPPQRLEDVSRQQLPVSLQQLYAENLNRITSQAAGKKKGRYVTKKKKIREKVKNSREINKT